MPVVDYQEHPFAEFIKILGKGKKGSKPLTREQAYQAMKMILGGQVQSVQLGAFLMLMRVKEETPEELAGFVQAAREALPPLPEDFPQVQLDWSSYAGKRRQLPWFILSSLLLAENGITILMHGTSGHTQGRIYTQHILELLGLPAAHSYQEAASQIADWGFSYLPLQCFSSTLHEIIELRPLMGLRSPVHSIARMLNPSNAPHSFQAIFHPGYSSMHQQASHLIKQPNMAVLKGEGGEAERNPDMVCKVQSVHGNQLTEEEWPAMFAKRHRKPDLLDPKDLSAVWQGELASEYAEATVIGTVAIVLKLMQKADTQSQAEQLAEHYWNQRAKEKFSAMATGVEV
ncbi:MAG: glycosyl transferase family protein [Methylococcaceae bacterium]